MHTVLVAALAWIGLSIPASFVFGAMLRSSGVTAKADERQPLPLPGSTRYAS